jgi:hypothetical protein
MSQAGPYEYDCSECGRHIVNILGPVPFDLCATCISLPGWMDDPELVLVLDPDSAPIQVDPSEHS